MVPVNQRCTQQETVWIKKAARGSLEAFNQLVLKYQEIAFHYAYTLVQDPDTAEDITQEAFIKAYTNIRQVHGSSFRPWLLKIVTNTAYNLMRISKRHPTQSLFFKDDNSGDCESSSWLVDPAASVETMVERNEESRQLSKLLSELPVNYRTVISLVDVFEHSYAEAALILQIPLGTVKSRLTRARLHMMKNLQNEWLPQRHAGWFGYQAGDSQIELDSGSCHERTWI